MSDTEDLSGVLRRIAKLMAIADDTRANPQEASAAAAMAAKIMAKYQLDHADVIEAELLRGNGSSFCEEDLQAGLNPDQPYTKKDAPLWARWVTLSVAKLNDCNVLFAAGPKGKVIRFQGYASDAQVAKFTYHYLVNTMYRASRHFAKYHLPSPDQLDTFRLGFMDAVQESLKAAIAEKEALRSQGRGNQLMVVKANAVAKHFGPQRFGRNAAPNRGGESYNKGVVEGRKVDINRRGVTGTAGPQQMRIT